MLDILRGGTNERGLSMSDSNDFTNTGSSTLGMNTNNNDFSNDSGGDFPYPQQGNPPDDRKPDDLLFLGNTVFQPATGHGSSDDEDHGFGDFTGESALLGHTGGPHDDDLSNYVLGGKMQTPDSGQTGTQGQVPPEGLTVSAGGKSGQDGPPSWFGDLATGSEPAPTWGLQNNNPQTGAVGGPGYRDQLQKAIDGGGRPFSTRQIPDAGLQPGIKNPLDPAGGNDSPSADPHPWNLDNNTGQGFNDNLQKIITGGDVSLENQKPAKPYTAIGGRVDYGDTPYDGMVAAAKDGVIPPPSDDALKEAWTQQQRILGMNGQKSYSFDFDGGLRLNAKDPVGSLDEAMQDGVVDAAKGMAFRGNLVRKLDVQAALAGKRAYTVDPETGLAQFQSGQELKGLQEMAGAGVMTGDQVRQFYPMVQQLDQKRQDLLADLDKIGIETGMTQDWADSAKAALVGLGRGGATAAGATLGAGAGAAVGIESGPGAFITILAGAVAGGYLSAKAYDALLEKFGEYSTTVRSFNEAAGKFPIAAGTAEMAANILAPGLVLNKSGEKIAQTLRNSADKIAFNAIRSDREIAPMARMANRAAARYLDATADSVAENIGGPARGIQDLIMQSKAQLSIPGQTGWNVAGKIATEMALRAGVSVAVDTALKQATGEGQTYGGALQAAAVGALATGHGIKFPGYKEADLGDIILRGTLHDLGGGRLGEDMTGSQITTAARLRNVSPDAIHAGYAQGLSEQESEVYNAFKKQIANGSIPADKQQVALKARQAFASGLQKNIVTFAPAGSGK